MGGVWLEWRSVTASSTGQTETSLFATAPGGGSGPIGGAAGSVDAHPADGQRVGSLYQQRGAR